MNKNDDILSHMRLMLNVNHPALEDCWSEGYEASQLTEDEAGNPYPQGSVENEHWSQGWWAAYYGEEHLYASEVATTPIKAANEPRWRTQGVKLWASRVAKIAGAIAVTVAAVELLDIAI